MNENNQDPQSNIAFNANTNPDTQSNSNPFTGDLKGEFTSDFGTNTNAVSQIFKSNGFASENRSKYLIGGGALILVVAALVFVFTGEDDSQDPFETEFVEGDIQGTETGEDLTEEELFPEADPIPAVPAEGGPAVDDFAQELAPPSDQAIVQDGGQQAATDQGVGQAGSQAFPDSGAPVSVSLVSPIDGASQSYDETSGPAEFSWEGPADRIVFSRSPSLQPAAMSVALNGATSYALENPFPGTWYWRVEAAGGVSEIRSFRINAPERRNFPIVQPTDGGSLPVNSAIISWQAGEKIARYAVEVVNSGESFASPVYRFQTSGTSVALQGVNPGSYDIRVGAFSEVAGRWEWQVIRGVSIQ